MCTLYPKCIRNQFLIKQISGLIKQSYANFGKINNSLTHKVFFFCYTFFLMFNGSVGLAPTHLWNPVCSLLQLNTTLKFHDVLWTSAGLNQLHLKIPLEVNGLIEASGFLPIVPSWYFSIDLLLIHNKSISPIHFFLFHEEWFACLNKPWGVQSHGLFMY